MIYLMMNVSIEICIDDKGFVKILGKTILVNEYSYALFWTGLYQKQWENIRRDISPLILVDR